MSSSEQPERPQQPGLADPSAAIDRLPAQSAQHAAEPVETIVGESTVIVRRAPRYFNFMLLGAVLGAIVAFVLTVSFPENPQFGRLQVFGFLLLALLALGVGLGCLAALIVDRFVSRGGTTAVADRLDARVPGVSPDATSAADATSGGPGNGNDGAASGASGSRDSGTKPE